MIPVKDNIPRERFPLVTTTVVAVVVAIYALSSRRVGLLPFVLDVGFLALLGPSVESALGRARFCGLFLLAGAIAVAAWALIGGDSPSPLLCASLGVVVAVVGGYLLLFPHARVITLIPLPFYTTLVEIPAAALVGVWLALQVIVGVAGVSDPIGAAPSWAQAIGAQ
jgi:membrane associated rhomboid family serine protease